jgi:hypothetical protein
MKSCGAETMSKSDRPGASMNGPEVPDFLKVNREAQA